MDARPIKITIRSRIHGVDAIIGEDFDLWSEVLPGKVALLVDDSRGDIGGVG